MISIEIKGHHHSHDLYEMAKAFFPNSKILIFEDKAPPMGTVLISSFDPDKGALASKPSGSLEYRARVEDFERAKEFPNINYLLIKSAFYQLLMEISQKNLPWGILTGIRPVKIGHSLAAKGFNSEEMVQTLVDLYKLDIENAELIVDITKNQKKYLKELPGDYSLYVNIPFCPSICHYCNFNTLSVHTYEDRIGEYVEFLISEISHTGKLMKGHRLNTVYIGGGTPSSIEPVYMDSILKAIRENLGPAVETTVECGRPETITEELIEILKESKVDRICINPQTMNNHTLGAMGRNHSSRDIEEAYKLIKELGDFTVNMDLIAGLPGENYLDFQRTLYRIGEFDPDNLTIHTLSIKKDSELEGEEIDEEMSELANEMLKEGKSFARRNNYQPYYMYRQKSTLGNLENIGFTKEGKGCIYNIISMEETETIVGVGMGAVSKFHGKRIQRIPNFRSYPEYTSRFSQQLERKEEALNRAKEIN